MMNRRKKCRKGFHQWIEVDADVWTITVCKTCRADWDFDNLAWWEKLKWEIQDIISHRQAKKFIKENWQAPF